MENISGSNLQVTLVASRTFPTGIVLTKFSDDTDPFDIPSIQVADVAMGLNGHMEAWSKASPIKITLGIIPNSDDDINLSILLQANRPITGQRSTLDIITMTGAYNDGSTITLIDGVLTDGMPGKSIASAGRLKTPTYAFAFSGFVRT